jgi:chromosome partitioning protein
MGKIMPTIVVASPKGGVGKSTTANILMTSLARRGASVTGIDADLNRPQIKWAKRAGVRTPSDDDQLESTVLPSLTVIEETGEESLIATIEAAAARTQFVVVDLEGIASQAATFAISQADMVIIPCGPSYLDATEAAAVLRVVAACEKMARRPLHIPAAVLLTKTSPAVQPDTLREVERQFAAHKTPVYDVRLHMRTAYAAIFSRGVPLHDLNPAKVHKLDAAIENAEAFMAETIRRLDHAQTGAERAVA